MNTREKIAKSAKKRKNFLPTLISTGIIWIILILFVLFVDPYSTAAVPLFFFFSFLATLFLFSLIFVNTRRGFLASLGIVVFLILLYFGIGSVHNLLLIFGILIVIEFYFLKT